MEGRGRPSAQAHATYARAPLRARHAPARPPAPGNDRKRNPILLLGVETEPVDPHNAHGGARRVQQGAAAGGQAAADAGGRGAWGPSRAQLGVGGSGRGVHCPAHRLRSPQTTPQTPSSPVTVARASTTRAAPARRDMSAGVVPARRRGGLRPGGARSRTRTERGMPGKAWGTGGWG